GCLAEVCVKRSEPRRPTAARRVLLALAAVLAAVSAAVAGPPPAAAQNGVFPEVYRRESFLMQALLQAEAGDFLGDGRTGLAVSGRNYETNEARSEEHTSELQSRENLVCRLLLEKKKESDERSSMVWDIGRCT